MISLKVATAATTTLMREKKINAPGRNSNVDRHGGRKCGETGARKLILAQTWQHVSHSSHSQTRCDHKAGSDSSRRPQTESEAGRKKINKKRGGRGGRRDESRTSHSKVETFTKVSVLLSLYWAFRVTAVALRAFVWYLYYSFGMFWSKYLSIIQWKSAEMWKIHLQSLDFLLAPLKF